jgi:hypothetical protein
MLPGTPSVTKKAPRGLRGLLYLVRVAGASCVARHRLSRHLGQARPILLLGEPPGHFPLPGLAELRYPGTAHHPQAVRWLRRPPHGEGKVGRLRALRASCAANLLGAV